MTSKNKRWLLLLLLLLLWLWWRNRAKAAVVATPYYGPGRVEHPDDPILSAASDPIAVPDDGVLIVDSDHMQGEYGDTVVSGAE